MLKKIAIIGPESTGKSTLCELLAKHYKTQWCPEYAREYLLTYGTKYTYDDLLKIAKGQVALEEKYLSSMGNGEWVHHEKNLIENHSPLTTHHSPLFIDTEMYVMKVWCEFVFDKCHRFVLDQIVNRKYDLYFLCGTDMPWVKDELREYPDLATREKLYSIYKDIMINQSAPWVEIKGNYDERLSIAIKATDELLKA